MAVLAVLLQLGGCRNQLRLGAQPDIPIADHLPAGWTPIGGLQAINIDGDASTEYLLLYVYDSTGEEDQQPNGPVGALVYDSQTDTQQGINFKTYRILPSYWTSTDPGIVAAPDQQNEVDVLLVRRPEQPASAPPVQQTDATAPANAENARRADELILFAGDTRLTVAWWQNEVSGYGATQVFAPGGLYELEYGPDGTEVDGETLSGPLLSMHGHFPLHDRSLLCYQVGYVRTLDTVREPVRGDGDLGSHRAAVRYQESPQGLRFCQGAPEHPFYPEGVTLAYLLDPLNNDHLLHPALSLEERERIPAFVEDFIGTLNSTPHVEDVKAHRAIPAPAEDELTGLNRLSTYTCASILTRGGPRLLRVELSHVPPDVETRMSDRLFIENVQPFPDPPDDTVPSCSDEIEDGVPERRWQKWY